MLKHRFGRHHHGEVVLDLCFPCQGIWFDTLESTQIAPGGIVELFKLIHEHHNATRRPLRDLLQCPRCHEKLKHGTDVTKYGGRFNYHRCLQKHGRFTTFSQFMIEKGFVKRLTTSEIAKLTLKISTIRCGGCGAPVDISQHHACTHCRSPITILDPVAVEQALARYQRAETQWTKVDVNPLAETILMRERYKAHHHPDEKNDVLNRLDVVDLLVSGIEMVWKNFPD